MDAGGERKRRPKFFRQKPTGYCESCKARKFCQGQDALISAKESNTGDIPLDLGLMVTRQGAAEIASRFTANGCPRGEMMEKYITEAGFPEIGGSSWTELPEGRFSEA